MRQNRSLGQHQEAAATGPAGDVGRFSSPYPDTPPMQPPPHNLFRDARPTNDTWLDEQGNEFILPQMMMEDQNWTSQRAQDFWRDIDASRTHRVPVDDLWGPLPDGDDSSSSESDEDDAGGCEMPRPSISKSGSDDFAPYPSKTISILLLVSEEND